MKVDMDLVELVREDVEKSHPEQDQTKRIAIELDEDESEYESEDESESGEEDEDDGSSGEEAEDSDEEGEEDTIFLPGLRFGVGQRVVVYWGDETWGRGCVVALCCEFEDENGNKQIAPYKVKLEGGQTMCALLDSDTVIREFYDQLEGDHLHGLYRRAEAYELLGDLPSALGDVTALMKCGPDGPDNLLAKELVNYFYICPQNTSSYICMLWSRLSD
jgi:hypothetical protein